MDLREIQALIKFVSINAVDEVEISQKDFKLLIRKNPAQVVTTTVAAPVMQQVAAAAPVVQASAPATPVAVVAPPAADNLLIIKSPICMIS